MDLLAGYGSDIDSDQEEVQEVSQQQHLDAIRPLTGATAAPSLAPAPPIDPSPVNMLSKLPAPSSSKAPLFSGLPKPKPAPKKVVVQFRVPITYGDAPAVPNEDEEPAKKKRKASTRGLSLAELLPAPKNEGRVGMRLGASAAVAGSSGRRRYDSDDDDDVVPGTEDRTGMELGAGNPNEPEDNEAYRVQPAGAAAAAAAAVPSGAGAAPQYQEQQQQQYGYGGDEWGQYYAQQGQHYDYASHGGAPAAVAAADPGQALLDAALEAERQKAVRRGELDPFAAAGVQIKEVKADSIRYMDPSQRASISAVRTALGSDYEARLRAEAGPSVPNKLARRKHQIGSLYAHAKAKELEDFERKAAGMKSKAETQSKYGW